MSQPESVLSAAEVDRITANWTTGQDTCHDYAVDYIPAFDWPCVPATCGDLLVNKRRDLPEVLKTEALKYIVTVLVLKKYPFQLWPELARPMVHRFLDVWNDTGDKRKAMRAI